MYSIVYTEEAKTHIAFLRRNEPSAFKKVTQLLLELCDHPTTGTGHPGSSESREERAFMSFPEMKERRRSQPLKGGQGERWSRRITQKHRLVYEIHDTEVLVLVLAAYGHYGDK